MLLYYVQYMEVLLEEILYANNPSQVRLCMLQSPNLAKDFLRVGE